MKQLKILIGLLFLVQTAKSQVTESSYADLNYQDYLSAKKYEVISSSFDKIYEAKIAMVNGNLDRAYALLSKTARTSPELALIRNYYLSILYFLFNKHEQAYQSISDDRYNQERLYKRVCTLKTFLQIILRKKSPNAEFEKCYIATSNNSDSDMVWLDFMVQIIKQNPNYLDGELLKNISTFFVDESSIMTWLKLGLLLGKEDVINANLAQLPKWAYESEHIRELIALNFYRIGKIKQAQEFISDIALPNAENIKGNIRLDSKNYELAYGHYTVALEKKKNSKMAIQRTLPLSWLLSDWARGEKVTQRINDSRNDSRAKNTLLSAFMFQQKKYTEAIEMLFKVQQSFNNKIPMQVSELFMLSFMMTGNEDRAKNYALDNCRKYDGLSCYVYLQMNLWPNFTQLMFRDDQIETKKNIEALQSQKSDLSEIVYVNQKDIEELDEKDKNFGTLSPFDI